MSQLGQDILVDEYFGGKRGGVFVDIGAYDGVTFSNTLMLERERGWTGVCIEPLPDVFAELRQNRGCVCVQACIGDRVLYTQAARSRDRTPLHTGPRRGPRQAEECLLDVLLMSRCRHLVHGNSSVTNGVLVFNPSMRHDELHLRRESEQVA